MRGRERKRGRVEGAGGREMLWTVTVHSRRRRYGHRPVDTRWILIGCFIICARQQIINNETTKRAEAPELIVARQTRIPPCELKSNLCSIFFFAEYPLPFFFPPPTEAAEIGLTHRHRAGAAAAAAADASHSCMECRNKVRIRPPVGHVKTGAGSLG